MSKIGFHISAGNHRGLGECLKKCTAAGHPVPVIFSVDQNIWPDIEQHSPKTVYIFRTQKNISGKTIGDGPGSIYTGDPVQTARDWMNEMMPVWTKNKAHYYAPLNEQDPAHIEGFTWLNTFTLECLTIAEANGYPLALYAFSGGNPKDVLQPASGRPFTRDDAWRELIPSLQRAKAKGHILLLHEYGFKFGELRKSQPYLGLRYRHAYRYLALHNADAPLVVSEASSDAGFGMMNPALWLADVKWYDSEIMKDKDVIGCCLYQLGGAENFVGMVPQLADYISRTPTIPLAQQAAPVVDGPDLDADGQAVSDALVFLTDRPDEVERWRVICRSLRVRVQPSTSAAIVVTLLRGHEFVVTSKATADGYEWGKTPNGWVALQQIVEPLTERVV